jgi:3-oxoacyl-[acyl-carrier protein] reductase
MKVDLNGKVAVITGAGSGLGQAYAWLLAECGAQIVVQDIRPEGAEVTANGVRTRARDCVVEISDISDPASAERVIRAGESRFGAVDIVINNAGIGTLCTIEEIDETAFDQMFGVHVKGSFFCGRAAMPGMKKRRSGRIINIASRWALAGHTLASDYVGAKVAILGLTKAWALELAPYNITVNAIAPGGVLTHMSKTHRTKEQLAADIAQVPLGRWQEPEEFASVIAFLVSDYASFITGQVISPNGGRTIVGF